MAARRPRHTPASAPATFAGLGVPAPVVRALAARGITTPTPIQAATLPDSMAGRDVLGRGRTGSGKTYAFVLPMLTRLAAAAARPRPGRPRALVLVPTRELATQIEATIAPLAEILSLRTLTVFGGVRPGPQVAGLRAGVDVLVACPGRLADHVRAGDARLDDVEISVLDEADHMADLGFLPEVRRLLDRTPPGGQRLLFSATLDAGVDVLVRRFLTDPVTHSVDSPLSPVGEMSHHVLHVRRDDRFPVLVDLAAAPGRTLVFTRTKRGAKTLARRLVGAGVPAVELHGNLNQNARSRNLLAFSDGRAGTLVATDIAARGIHVDDVTLVIHADPPVEHKAYLHRSGRTARSGAEGTVVTLMTDDQVSDVRDLTRQAGITPTTTRLRPGDPLLTLLAPGERSFVPPPTVEPPVAQPPRRAPRTRAQAGQRERARTTQRTQATRDSATRDPAAGGARRRSSADRARVGGAASPRAGGGAPARGSGTPSARGAGAPSARGSGSSSARGFGASSTRGSGAADFSARARVGRRRGRG